MFSYILFDSSQHMRFSSRLDRLGAHYVSLFDGHPEEPFVDIAPLLIDVTVDCEITQAVVDETTRIGLMKPCVSTLESTKSLQQLADHLRRFHLFQMSNGKLMVMRWYDTRILPVLMGVLDPQQLATFTDGITAWQSYDRFGTVQEQRISSNRKRPNERAPLTLDVVQEAALFDASEPDVLIYELRRNIRAEIDRVSRHVLHPFIGSHWQKARDLGVTERADQLQLMILALSTSGRYAEHAIVIDRLKSGFADGQQSFQQWIENLPEEVWAIGRPLWVTNGAI